MDKRYQVFVSSTYADLQEERQHVLQALMEMDCIPAGMELFPAVDEEQWEFIKKVIDDCDYYLLIIGGRYGSITQEGISYTEKEFDYAIKRNLKVIALIHGAPEDIPLGKSEKDPVLRDKLSMFKDKVMTGRLVKFWQSAAELPGLVALSMTKTIKMYPAVGWVRANHVASENILAEINELRKDNSALQQSLNDITIKEKNIVEGISDIDSVFTIHGDYYIYFNSNSPSIYSLESRITWRQIFTIISPYLLKATTEFDVGSILLANIHKREKLEGKHNSIDNQDLKTISIQFKAYDLIKIEVKNNTIYWSLTKKGEQLMMESRIVRSETK